VKLPSFSTNAGCALTCFVKDFPGEQKRQSIVALQLAEHREVPMYRAQPAVSAEQHCIASQSAIERFRSSAYTT